MSEPSPAEAIFQAALEKTDAAERDAFLDEACVGDKVLRRRVERLLVAHTQVGDFLEQPVREVVGLDALLAPDLPAGAAESAAWSWRPSVPGYEILGVLGKGGMGVVFQARHLALKRVVALKMILHAEHAGAQERERFGAEAEAVARLQHPNIVQIYEVGEAGGHPFCALEFIGGGNLAQRLASAPLSPPAAAELVQTLAEAVHAAHQAGIVHRDLKPANVLLQRQSETRIANLEFRNSNSETNPNNPSSDSDFAHPPTVQISDFEPKITDFGLAKRIEDTSGLTQTGQLLGTPSYMAPEQTEAGANAIGPATDVYALGAILYECLTGRPPFRGATVLETLEQVRTREPAAPRLLQPGVPRDLETIALKCLRKGGVQRYPTARELAEDLGRFLRGEPVRARPVGGLERAWAWARRRPALAAACALAVLLLVVSVAGGTAFWFWREAETARQGAETARREADDARQGEAAAKERLDRVFDLHRVQLAYREWQENNVLRARQLLAECAPERRHWEWAFVDRLTHPLGELQEPLSRPLRGLVWSADGSRILTFDQEGGVRVWDPSAGRDLRAMTVPVPGPATSDGGPHPAAATPDGRRIIARTRPRTLTVWDPEGRKVAEFHLAAPPGCLACSPDGRSFAFGCAGTNQRSAQTHVCAVETGKTIFVLEDRGQPVSAVAYSPDGKRLAAGDVDGAVRVWDAVEGKLEKTLPSHPATVTSLAFHPDNRRLAAGAQDGTIRVWDVTAGKELFTRDPRGGEVGAVVFSPDNRRLAAGLENGTVVLWDERGKEAFTLRAHLGDRPGVTGLAFSADGLRLASSSLDGTTRIWDATESQEGGSLEVPVPFPTNFGLSGGGRWLLLGSIASHVVVWDRIERRQTAGLSGHTAPVAGVACSADGRRVASIGVDGFLRAWELPSRRELIACKGHETSGGAVAVDPAGTLVASGGGEGFKSGEVKVWDLATGELRFDLPGHGGTVNQLAFSPGGTRLASASPGGLLRVQDPRSGIVLWTHQGTADFRSLAFSPDGAALACGDRQGTVTVRETETGREFQTLRGHTKPVTGLAFHPDGRRLASGGLDSTVRLWDLASGQEALLLRSDQPLVAFGSDGHSLFATGNGPRVRVWPTGGREP
jgi:WD40 repeat protein/serine/threonine protein kinase